jgi:hypothetical protein
MVGRIRCGLAFGVATVLIAAATVSASAAVVSIGLSEDSGVISVVAGPTVSNATFSGVFGDYAVRADGTSPPLLPSPGVIATNNLSISTAGGNHTLDVYITAQGETLAGLLSFISSFTLNSTLGTVATTMSTYLDTGNGQFTLSTLLGTAGPFSTGPITEVDTLNANCGGLCSVTALYHVATTGAAASNATINVNAVPGPIAGAGLPGLVAACFGLVALVRRRRNAAVA